jgi:TP901-1 family phage major tail protein
MALNGSAVLLLAQTVVGPPGTYVSVGGQTGAKIDKKAATIDITDKTMTDKAYLPTERSATVTLDSLYVPNDTAMAAIQNAYKNNTAMILERQESGTVLEYASGFVTQLSYDFKKAAAGTVAATFEVSGGWIAGSAP